MKSIIELHHFDSPSDFQRIKPLRDSYWLRKQKENLDEGPAHAIEIPFNDPNRFGKLYYTIYHTSTRIKILKGRKSEVL